MEINETWQNAFQSELRNNLYRLSNGCQKQLYIKDITQECLWYSLDMCLHYYRTGAFHGITADTIDNITYNVCVAMSKIIHELDDNDRKMVMKSVRELMKNPSEYNELQRHVDRYYGR